MNLLLLMLKSKETYRRGLRAPVRGLWSGEIDVPTALAWFGTAIRREFTLAYQSALQSIGMELEDMTAAEKSALELRIMQEIGHAEGFAADVMAANRESGTLLRVHLDRIEVWIQRVEEIKAMALTAAAKDPKLEWVLDPRKENCSSCQKLNGKVKRASFWRGAGILPAVPDAPYLECRGFNCGCQLRATDKPLSRGRLPGLP